MKLLVPFYYFYYYTVHDSAKHFCFTSKGSPTEIGKNTWRRSQVDIYFKTYREGVREVKKNDKGRDDLVDNRLLVPNKRYVELLEQVLLTRKQIVLVHEQLARIESKIGNLNTDLVRQYKKRDIISSNLGSCY